MLYRDKSLDSSMAVEEAGHARGRSAFDLAVQALRSHYKALVVWCAFCLFAGIVYVAVTPAEYAATATIILEPRRPAFLTQNDVNQVQQNLDSPQIDSQTQVIRSARVLSRVIKETNMATDPEMRGPQRGMFSMIRNLFSDEVETVPSLPVEAFASRVYVRRLGQSLVLEISVRASTPEKSARLTNAVLAAYIYDQVSTKLLDMRRTGDWLQSRIEDMRSQQDAALNAMRTDFAPDVSFPAADVRILSTATPLARKAFPNTALILAFALSLALFFGVGAIVVRRMMDRRVWGKEDLEEAIPGRFIATVPRLRSATGRKPALLLEAAVQQPTTRFAESFRAIRNEALSRGDASPRSIGVVSSRKGEGASIVAANLAHTLAASGAPVVLVDADLHTTALTRVLAGAARVGLANILNGEADLELVQLRGRLEFLPSTGTGSSVPPFLFIGSPGMRDLLQDLSRDKIVVVDLPALSESNDAVAIAALLDAIIVVVETGKTTVEEVVHVVQAIEHGKGAIFGTVLNKAAPAGLRTQS